MNLYFFLKFFLFKTNILFLLFIVKVILFALFEMVGIALLVTLVSILSGNNKSELIIDIFSVLEKYISLDLFNLLNLSLLTLFFYIFKSIYSIWFIKHQQNIIAKGHKDFCNGIFENYASGDSRLTRKFNSYEIIRNVNFISDKVFGEYFVSIFNLITEITVVIVLFSLFAYVDFSLSLILLVIGYIILKVLVKFVFNKSKIIGEKSVNAYGELVRIVNITIGLFKELRLLKLINIFRIDFKKSVEKYVNAKKFDNYISRLPVILIELFVVTIVVFLIIFQFDSDQKFISALPKLSLFAIGIVRLSPSINRISTNIHTIKFYTPSVMNLIFDFNFLKKANENTSNSTKTDFKKRIRFDKVTLNIFDESILKNISFTIDKGNKVLIYGESGSGKSSILNILSGLTKYNGGNVFIDGAATQKQRLELSNKISLVSQESFLIDNESIYYNICKKNKKKSQRDKKFDEIIKICDLDRFIKNITNKEHGIISENGKNISGGEKQRICIARSLYNDFDILLMDEPFSAIDKRSRNKIFKSILDKFKNKTIILVSHQKINDKFIDKFIKINNGRSI